MILGSAPVVSHPPLGVALLAAVLRDAGHEVYIIDAASEKPDQINDLPEDISDYPGISSLRLVTTGLSNDQIAALIPAGTEVIGLSCMFTSDWISDRYLLNHLHRKFPDILLVAGGESISGMAEICLRQVKGLKICITGEGEETILDLLDAIKTERPLSSVASIAYKEGHEIYRTSKRARIKQVDEIPIPAWELFPVSNYPKHGQVNGMPSVTLPLLATRGCPYQCTFCTSPEMWGTRYYMRTPENVVNEIEYVMRRFGAYSFDFFDLTAIIKKQWILDFTRILKERNINIHWRIPAGTRSEALDEEVCKALYEAGCKFIVYAPESGSPRLLKEIKKKVNLENLLQSLRYANKQNMVIFINMIIGLPGEKHKDIWKTILFLAKCARVGVNDIGLAKFRPYPGSQLFNDLIRTGELTWEDDRYIIESLMAIDTVFENKVYNKHIGKNWYTFYYLTYLLVFYGSQMIYHPGKLKRIVQIGSAFNYRTKLIKELPNPIKILKSKLQLLYRQLSSASH